MIKENVNRLTTSWAEDEFGMVDFGDQRLSKRLIKVANSRVKAHIWTKLAMGTNSIKFQRLTIPSFYQ